MGVTFKRLTDWERSPVVRLARRFMTRPEKAEKKTITVYEIVRYDKQVHNASLRSLLSAAHDSNPGLRVHAILNIRGIRDEALMPDLISLLKDDDNAIRSAASKAIRSIGLSEEHFRSVSALISEANTPEKRNRAISVFQEIGDPRFIRVMAENFYSKPEGAFPEAVWIIVATCPDNPEMIASIPSLIRLLFDNNGIRDSTKKSVAEMLGYIADLCKSKGSRELLAEQLKESREELERYPYPSRKATLVIKDMEWFIRKNALDSELIGSR